MIADLFKLNEKIVLRVNEIRIANSVRPLSVSDFLLAAAYVQSLSIGYFGYFSHLNPYFPLFYSPLLRVKAFSSDYRKVGENIIKYPVNSSPVKNSLRYPFGDLADDIIVALAEEIVNSWMNSDSHKENVLNVEYDFTGVFSVFYQDSDHRVPVFIVTQIFGASY